MSKSKAESEGECEGNTMSRHKIVKNLDLNDELDEFDGGGGDDYYAYESNGYDGGGGGGIEGISKYCVLQRMKRCANLNCVCIELSAEDQGLNYQTSLMIQFSLRLTQARNRTNALRYACCPRCAWSRCP